MRIDESCPACNADVHTSPARKAYGSYFLVRCSHCKSEFLRPQPDDTRLAEIYDPDYYEAWQWEMPEVVQAMKARTFSRALRLLELGRGSRLLDVGCAQGELAEVALSLGLVVTGLDRNPKAIEIAQQRVSSATFACGELDSNVVGAGWDIITMFDFIEHVRNPSDTLAAAANSLAPGGHLLISTPRIGSTFHRLTGHFWPQYREEHLVLFSVQGIRSALSRVGLRITRVVPTVKFVSLAYLIGQAAEYGPPLAQSLARGSRAVLKTRFAHKLVPLRFGEMTLTAVHSS